MGPGRYFAASLPLLFFHLHYLSTVYTLSFPFSFNTPTRWWGSSAFGNPKRAAGASSVCPDSHARAVADRAGAAGSTLGTATSARWAAEAFSLFLSEVFSYKFYYRFFSKKLQILILNFCLPNIFLFQTFSKTFFHNFITNVCHKLFGIFFAFQNFLVKFSFFLLIHSKNFVPKKFHKFFILSNFLLFKIFLSKFSFSLFPFIDPFQELCSEKNFTNFLSYQFFCQICYILQLVYIFYFFLGI